MIASQMIDFITLMCLIIVTRNRMHVLRKNACSTESERIILLLCN